MALHDIDDMDGAIREAARVLTAGGHLCLAIVHPIDSAGRFEVRPSEAPFIIRESYFGCGDTSTSSNATACA